MMIMVMVMVMVMVIKLCPLNLGANDRYIQRFYFILLAFKAMYKTNRFYLVLDKTRQDNILLAHT